MVLFNAVNGEGTDASDMGVGAGFGAISPILWKALWWIGKKTKNLIGNSASKLELSGIINPWKLKKVQDQLLQEGASFPWKATPQDVGKWMLERGFKWSKEKIVSQLNDHATKSKNLVDELLSLSNSKHSIQEIDEALNMLFDDYAKYPWLKEKLGTIVNTSKRGGYTLSEMNQVKRYMDDAYNMFKQSGGETAGLKAEGLRNIRQTIKKTIEEVAEAEGLGNIKMLNNETQIAKGLADGITKKDTADTVREFLSPFSSMRNGAILWGVSADFSDDGSINFWSLGRMAKGAILWAIIGNTKAKTVLANMLKKLGGIEKKEITQRIATNGTSKLSEKSTAALTPVLEKGKTILRINKNLTTDYKKLSEYAINKLKSSIGTKKNIALSIWEINPKVEKMLKNAGIKEIPTKHTITRNGVKHILDNHGIWSKRLRKNEVPVRMKDIKLIPSIINNPDKISISPSKTKGLRRDALIYEKKIGDHYYYVESINKTKGTLETQTMYINK